MDKQEEKWEVGQEVLFDPGVTYGTRDVSSKIVRVVAVKQYKRGRKVITDDGGEWDVDCTGKTRRWGTRVIEYYNGPSIKRLTPALRTVVTARDRDLHWRRGVEKVLSHWDTLSPEKKQAIYEVAHAALSSKKGKR